MAFVQLPKAWQPQSAALTETLFNGVANDQHVYALIDLASSTAADDWLAYLQQISEAYSLFENQPEEAAKAQAPWLFPLHANAEVTRTMNEALVNRNVIWVISSLPALALQKRLSNRLAAVMEEDTDKSVPPSLLFRFYDVRLFPGWWKSLTKQEKATFGAFASSWQQLNHRNELVATALSGVPDEDPLTDPWVVTPAQQAALTDYSERYQLIHFLGKRQPDLFFSLTLEEQWQFVSEQDAAAKADQISALKDRLHYCEAALTKKGQVTAANH